MLDLDKEWDVIVIGGGITGAGIFRQSVQQGHKTLLVERRDFAWGTSSRSSKLIHGGLRYLKEGRVRLVRDAVREREALISELPGLVDPLAFLLPVYRGQSPSGPLLRMGLWAYDALGLRWRHSWLDREQFVAAAPQVRRDELLGGARFFDAKVDDSRLVLRTLFDGEKVGGALLSYTRVQLIGRQGGRTHLTLSSGPQKCEVSARVIFGATGVWIDALAERPERRLRPLRGSHIVFPLSKLPLASALSFHHPADRRPIFLIPWEGATFCGTTDLDHSEDLNLEPRIHPDEVRYLVEGLRHCVPDLNLGAEDIVSTWAGVRPVLSEGKEVSPSKEGREHGVWEDDGLVTVTGGKLTTFRLMAREALARAARYLGPPRTKRLFTFATPARSTLEGLPEEQARRLLGRYGDQAAVVCQAARDAELETIPGTETLWVEIRWAARAERVRHLEDLMLRRTRLGLTLADGGEALLSRIGRICREESLWTDEDWEIEVEAYLSLWRRAYGPPYPVLQAAVADQ